MSQTHQINPWLLSLAPFALTKNEELKKRFQNQGREVYDFTLGDPQEPTPLFIQEALKAGVDAVSQYPSHTGSFGLREACAHWAHKRLGVTLHPEKNVLSSNGSKEAIFHLPQILLHSGSPKRMVIFPEPGYPVYQAGTVLAGGVPYAAPLSLENNYVFDPEQSIPQELCSQIAALWICYPHNPTGALLTVQQLQNIYKWALKHNVVLLSDECYIDTFFESLSTPPVSLLEVACHNDFKNVLCFFSLSKRSGMTGYRSGFVAGHAELISQFSKYRLNVGLGTPDFVQKAAIAAWGEESHVVERNKIFAQKRSLVEAFFLKKNIHFLPSQATFYIWAQIPPAFSSSFRFREALLEKTGILVTPGLAFGLTCERFFRMALVPTQETMKRCLSAWEDHPHFWENLKT